MRGVRRRRHRRSYHCLEGSARISVVAIKLQAKTLKRAMALVMFVGRAVIPAIFSSSQGNFDHLAHSQSLIEKAEGYVS